MKKAILQYFLIALSSIILHIASLFIAGAVLFSKRGWALMLGKDTPTLLDNIIQYGGIFLPLIASILGIIFLSILFQKKNPNFYKNTIGIPFGITIYFLTPAFLFILFHLLSQ